jgi:hypothetical protein
MFITSVMACSQGVDMVAFSSGLGDISLVACRSFLWIALVRRGQISRQIRRCCLHPPVVPLATRIRSQSLSQHTHHQRD